ncbi:hypothetical protein GK3050 [Geobacillus kaustophilus HTA426]|uniref:Uncharacterized protein n=1 Tax=Geobacillus kaustophilus (strain HTA426) TaxID=235909 RepID=Q5KVF1_GEOKA|nr:hypothetical protein GK3050 [Geobacillus kaustophilus HTA426]
MHKSKDRRGRNSQRHEKDDSRRDHLKRRCSVARQSIKYSGKAANGKASNCIYIVEQIH